ncbi:MAG: DNA polymerase III subunit beta [Gammaproteobacteria bacterium]|jgi:DNA polymerase-3 subunit beta|nr:DNA polymerase III subunit beta [Chromatiales bacterium]MDP6414031.1 DNA polymerase III subunit beta [Gammaproteobacteria bacterium]MDP6673737.1 DNA polymerase III subunit beta [Gammaproteobacteria bacterium]
MKITSSRESFLRPLQAIIGVVERRQTMPILANVLLQVKDNRLSVTASDLEVELVAEADVDEVDAPGEITVPARKFLDICRSLPAESTLKFHLDGDRLILKSGRSRFVLSTLPATDFPVIDDINANLEIKVGQAEFRRLLDKTHFSMAQQDVRYYLNGLLVEIGSGCVRAVATDGHRLALCEMEISETIDASQQVIVPRKGVLELQKLLGDGGEVQLSIGTNHIRAHVGNTRFTSKLIDGRFPDYDRVIPKPEANLLMTGREYLRGALQRASILSNEKYRGVRLDLSLKSLRIQANNPDHEEAQDELEVDYSGMDMEIGFNVNYLLDALSAVDTDDVEVGFVDSNSSCIVKCPGDVDSKFVVMPMRL